MMLLGRDVERLEKMIEALAEENSLAPGNIPTVTKRVNALREGLEQPRRSARTSWPRRRRWKGRMSGAPELDLRSMASTRVRCDL